MNTTWSNETTLIRANKKQVILVLLKWFTVTILIGIILFFTIFGIDLNLHVTIRKPFSSMKQDFKPSSSNCFKDYIPESSLNQRYGIIPSIPLIKDDLCYDFVSLIKPTKNISTIYHTLWTNEVTHSVQLAALRSFIVTQSTDSILYIWTFKDIKNFIDHDDRIQIQIINNQDLIQNTPLTDPKWLSQQQQHLLKLVTLYKFGGVWFDLNTLFVRNMSPLLSQEWVSQSHCLETTPKEGSFLHFFKNSPYLCEIMTEANQQLLENNYLSLDLYKFVFHRLLKLGIQTWSILPWCYTDPSQCLKSNSLPTGNRDFDINKLNKVFAFHLHKSSAGSVFQYLVNQQKQLISW